MSICVFPILKIYEDFDKMSAKEVRFTEKGEKITVKLLHFPDFVEGQVPCCDDDIEIKNVEVDKVYCCRRKNSREETAMSSSEENIAEKSSERRHSHESKRVYTRKKSSSNVCGKCSKITEFSRRSSGTKNPTYMEYKIPPEPSTSHSRKKLEPIKSPGGLRKQVLFKRSLAPLSPAFQRGRSPPSPNSCTGYDQYQKSLLEVPMPRDYGDASSDDLSSEWDSDVPEQRDEQKEQKVSCISSYVYMSTSMTNLFKFAYVNLLCFNCETFLVYI